MQYILGAGLKLQEGRFVLNGDYAAKAGMLAFSADQNKVSAGTLSCQGQRSTLENSMDHSETFWGTDSRPWV